MCIYDLKLSIWWRRHRRHDWGYLFIAVVDVVKSGLDRLSASHPKQIESHHCISVGWAGLGRILEEYEQASIQQYFIAFYFVLIVASTYSRKSIS